MKVLLLSGENMLSLLATMERLTGLKFLLIFKLLCQVNMKNIVENLNQDKRDQF